MRHFVHGPDGVKYGPADLATLEQWRNEGRLTPETLLEPEVGGTAFPAKNLPGLSFGYAQQNPAEHSGQTYANYPYPAVPGEGASKFVAWAWVLGIVSVCVCWPFLGPLAIYCAFRARSLGSPQGGVLIAYTITCMLIGGAIGITYAIQLAQRGFNLF